MRFLKKYQWILVLIGLALVVRLFVFLQIKDTTPFYDYFTYKEWIYKSYSFGLDKVYFVHSNSNVMDVDQPPGTIYVLRGFYEAFLIVAKALNSIFSVDTNKELWVNDQLLVFFFRFASMLADLAIGFCIYIAVKSTSSQKIALGSSAFYLLCPPILYNSTVWGQMDSINNLFFYVSLLLLLRRQVFFSVLSFGISLFTKFSLLPLAPLFVIFAAFGSFFKKKVFALSVLTTGIILWMLSIPFSTNIFWIPEIIGKISKGVSQEITVGAFNFWWIIFRPMPRINPPPLINDVYLGLSLATWAYVLFALFYIPILIYALIIIKKKKLTAEMIFLLSGLAAFSTFLFLPKMHERYLYPVFPLLITWAGLTNKRKYWIMLVLLAALHFLNLYIIWNPHLFLFRNFELVLKEQTTIWFISLGTLSIFLYLYIQTVLPYFSTLLTRVLSSWYKEKYER